MKIYFLSSQPCALMINGVYVGVTDKFSRFLEIPLKDNLFATFTPQGAFPLSLFINEKLLLSPPNGFEVYLLKDAIALYAKSFPAIDYQLKPLCQQRFENCLATLFSQGQLYLSLQVDGELFISTLPLSFSNASLSFHHGLLFIEGENKLAVFNKRGERLLQEEVLSYSLKEEQLHATSPLCDSLGHKLERCWHIREERLIQESFSITTEKEELQNEPLAYVFFESLLFGGNFENFLSDELLPNKAKIKAFIGNFVSVHLTEHPHRIAVMRKKKENLYEAVYFSVEVTDGKICDIKG